MGTDLRHQPDERRTNEQNRAPTLLAPTSPADFSNQDLRDQIIPDIDLQNANFKNAILKRCDFSGRDLSFADFRGADLYRADFRNAKLYAATFRDADLTRADFRNAELYGFKIYGGDVTNTVFDKIVFDERVAQGHEDYEKACQVNNMIKRTLKDHGDVELAAHYYYRQRVCQRKTKQQWYIRAFEYVFFDSLTGYGEKPARSIFWAAGLLCVFAFAFILLPNLGAEPIVDSTAVQPKPLSSVADYPRALELSVTAFVGGEIAEWDLSALGRTLISAEGLLGWVMLSVIVIGFARKLVRD
ncbi:MAG TPA: pentapeptide repeat-containing protein [Longimicrobium sp.]